MINTSKCKNTASVLAKLSKKQLDAITLENFNNIFNKIVDEYKQKYIFSSIAINLQVLDSFEEWLPIVLESKELLLPIIVDKMVNDKDLYSLSLYQNLYAGTDLIPNIDEYRLEYYENGSGENALALITGCHWIEQQNNEGL